MKMGSLRKNIERTKNKQTILHNIFKDLRIKWILTEQGEREVKDNDGGAEFGEFN
jgi:hypothetical protein